MGSCFSSAACIGHRPSRSTKSESQTRSTKTKSQTRSTKTKSQTRSTKTKSQTRSTKPKSQTRSTKPKSHTRSTKPKSHTRSTKTKSRTRPTAKTHTIGLEIFTDGTQANYFGSDIGITSDGGIAIKSGSGLTYVAGGNNPGIRIGGFGL